MAAESPMKKHLLEASCSICWEFFKDPIILDCEHIFCQDCIMKCWKPSLTKLACPQCKEMVSQEGFSPSQQLDNAIRLRKQLRDQAGGETKCCQQHQARLELFCKNDQVFVCSVCRGSEEHQAHTVIPVEKAALEFKITNFTSRRSKKTFVDPMTFSLWMKLGVWDLFDFSAFLGNIMKQFKANVTLDPDTAHPKLVLSEDHKSFWMGEKSQELTEDDRRFDNMMCVLGCEMFLTGRHYWDVVLENEGDWGVGVARNSVRRKDVMSFSGMKGIWAMAKWGCQWVYINSPRFLF